MSSPEQLHPIFSDKRFAHIPDNQKRAIAMQVGAGHHDRYRSRLPEDAEQYAEDIKRETKEGLAFIEKYPDTITFFGSARTLPSSRHYQDAEKLAGKFAQDGRTIATGGGPGIMEAANKGAKEAGGDSIGLRIKLPFEEEENPYLTDSMDFEHFFVRQNMLVKAGKAYVFFPGGVGTFYELFEVLTLMQTGKAEPVPIVLIGSDFWNGFHDWVVEQMAQNHQTISIDDTEMYTIVDSVDDAYKAISSQID